MTRQERNSYVESNLGLVRHWLQKYKSLPCYEDILQHGIMGMIEALDRMDDGNINQGYIKRYVCGVAITYITKLEPMVYKVNSGKGTYESVDCNSLDATVGYEGDTVSYGELLVDEEDAYEDVITKVDFEDYVNRSKINYKDEMLLFLSGYDRTDIAKAAGVSYEALRQQLKRLNKAAFV